jgi:hypothetical protein
VLDVSPRPDFPARCGRIVDATRPRSPLISADLDASATGSSGANNRHWGAVARSLPSGQSVVMRAKAVLLVIVGLTAGCRNESTTARADPKVESSPSSPSSRVNAAPGASPSTLTPLKLRNCLSRDLRGSADWQAGFLAMGGTPAHRTGGLEMEGSLKIRNASRSSCALPEHLSVRLMRPGGGPLALQSVERNFGLHLYLWDGPLAPGGIAAAPLKWEPSWCGTDPGLSPVLAVTLAPEDAPLRVRVTATHPEFPHVPSCNRNLRASVLVVAPFRQARPG